VNGGDPYFVGIVARNGGRAPRVFEKGRVCVENQCGTTLSRYNRGEYCSIHQPTRHLHLRIRR
jgi:hypothetical protein